MAIPTKSMSKELWLMRLLSVSVALMSFVFLISAFVDKHRNNKDHADTESVFASLFLLMFSVQTYTLTFMIRLYRVVSNESNVK